MTVPSDTRKALQEKLGPEKLEELLREVRQEGGGLWDDEAALALIADEHGLHETPFSRLADLEAGRPVFTRCRIESIEPVREFRSRDRAGKLRKLLVADQTATLALTLWDEETGLVEQLGLCPGAGIRILSATLKETRYGPEIQVGRTGFIVAEGPPREEGPPQARDIKGLEDFNGRVIVRGVVLSLGTSGRGRQKVTMARIFDGTGECEVAVPSDLHPSAAGLVVGAEIELFGARVDRSGRQFALYCDSRTTVRMV